MKIAEIMEKYNAQEMTLEEANAALKEAGATYHLQPLTDEEREAKKQREDEEGFFDPEERGFERKPVYPPKPDMSRNKALAGQVVRQTTKQGVYDVHYDEDGYAVKAKRVNL